MRPADIDSAVRSSRARHENDVNEFWSLARSFLKVYLPNTREVSQNTVKAYKQALETLIKYLEDSGFTRDTITIGMFTPACIEGFMVWMSKEQNCKPRTCNLRLSAIKTFLRYCGHHVITNESISREVLELPMKKVRKEKIEYMSNENADKARLRVSDIPVRIHCHLLKKSQAINFVLTLIAVVPFKVNTVVL